MKDRIKMKAVAALISVTVLMVGCTTVPQGPAHGQEALFRQALADIEVVKDGTMQVTEIRFSSDYQKVLVLFTYQMQNNEGVLVDIPRQVTLEHDGFDRYVGQATLPQAKKTGLAKRLVVVDLKGN